jgi:DNA repair protein RecO (recombination protein O)
MDWDAPAIVLSARAYGEGDALATVLTEAGGRYLGLARGGFSRQRGPVWQAGNLVQARWVARLADQLGAISGELVAQPGALVLDDPLSLNVLRAACALADGALPEREPHPRVFAGLLHLLACIGHAAPPLADLARWETALLADLGYGLDLSACALTGAVENLAYVSPRTGRAVAAAAAGVWRERLLPLPAFLLDPQDPGDPARWAEGLRLTGHFLARDAFGQRHLPLPRARAALFDRVAALAAETAGAATAPP